VAVIDWLTVTWQPESDDLHVAREVWPDLSRWLGGGVVGQECAGKYGYRFGCVFSINVHGSLVPVGRVDWGGDRHGGRARLDLSGSGCSRVCMWPVVREYIEGLEAFTLTRADLAVDCLMGEFGVEDARDWYLEGEFHAGGRRPRHSLVGDWLDPHYGRTLEIGRRENGKMLRAYEKGRQLGDSASPWTRFEVELRNIDRVLPVDVLTSPGKYFAGAYEALQRLLDVGAERIKTLQAEGEIGLRQLVQFHRSAYGQLVNVLRARLPAGDVLDALCREGVPRRLHKASLSAFHLLGAGALVDHQEVIR
jgi:phage replication initiation protein